MLTSRNPVGFRLVRLCAETAAIAGVLHDDALTYDARGKVLRVDVKAAGLRQASTYDQWYTGMGMLVATDWRNESDNGRAQEAYGIDALGNTAWRRSDDGGGASQDILFRHVYQPARGRLQTIESLNLGFSGADFYPEHTSRTYDRAGNADWSTLVRQGDVGYGTRGTVQDKRSRSYYGSDQRLRYFQERDQRIVAGLGAGTLEEEGVWEEYRYDPLGRRVLVNTRTKGICTTGMRSAARARRRAWCGPGTS